MANKEQLDILKQGVKVWNQWREEHRDIQPDLGGANLKGADLTGANLSKVRLGKATLVKANLTKTNLREAILTEADLSEADLSQACLISAILVRTILSATKLIGADLGAARLTWSDLSKANLTGANLSFANLTGTDLIDANLGHTRMGLTIVGDTDLSGVKGLETVDHIGPSVIGIDTIYHSQGNIPEVFLKGAGVGDTFITYMRSLVGKPIDYYSCFISYSSKDETFAKRLYADLQSNNVRCWFAPEDLKWGERIRTGIDEAIRLHDKLLLILSKSSVASGWVEREVKTALAKERKDKRTVLYPVRVDKAVFESPFDWATEIRHERNIGDFTRWKDHDAYQKAFDRLLRDLKAEAQKMESRDTTT